MYPSRNIDKTSSTSAPITNRRAQSGDGTGAVGSAEIEASSAGDQEIIIRLNSIKTSDAQDRSDLSSDSSNYDFEPGPADSSEAPITGKKRQAVKNTLRLLVDRARNTGQTAVMAPFAFGHVFLNKLDKVKEQIHSRGQPKPRESSPLAKAQELHNHWKSRLDNILGQATDAIALLESKDTPSLERVRAAGRISTADQIAVRAQQNVGQLFEIQPSAQEKPEYDRLKYNLVAAIDQIREIKQRSDAFFLASQAAS